MSPENIELDDGPEVLPSLPVAENPVPQTQSTGGSVLVLILKNGERQSADAKKPKQE
jgi:hypothetical protein